MNTPTTEVTIKLPTQLYKTAHRIATDNLYSVHDVLREALELYINDRPKLQKAIKERDRAIAREDALRLTLKEVIDSLVHRDV